MAASSSEYRFSFGPWNIHEGADPFGPPVRESVAFGEKLKKYKELGFDAVQFHDDDAVPNLEGKSGEQIAKEAGAMKRMLADHGLVAEFVAPRLWEDARGIDGGFTANDPKVRQWAVDRAKRCTDIADAVGTKLIVWWLAREGTYIREAKNAIDAHKHLLDAMNAVLEHNGNVEIAIEPKPNEPMDHAYVPTIGHAIALGQASRDPKRVGGLIESAHAILAGLDPSDEMAFALSVGKLWGVHLNDQNGLKFDEDKSFGAANLRMAWNQVRVLEKGGYAKSGRYVGLDVKALRTQKADVATKHLSNSRRIFLHLVEKVRTFDARLEQQYVAERDYEGLEMAVLDHLMGTTGKRA
jgi:xylose isomerase